MKLYGEAKAAYAMRVSDHVGQSNETRTGAHGLELDSENRAKWNSTIIDAQGAARDAGGCDAHRDAADPKPESPNESDGSE